MTDKERKEVVEVISDRINEEGSLNLNQLNNTFKEAGIDPSIYEPSGPKRWLQNNFPEFLIAGSNGKEKIYFSNNPIIRIKSIIFNKIDTDGKVLLSTIPQLLPEDLQYKKYSNGLSLTKWLPVQFPELRISDDNLWVMKDTEQESSSEGPGTQFNSFEEIQQMHDVAFMQWWSKNLKRLRTFNDELKSEDYVKGIIAHQFTQGMLGESEFFLNALVDGEQKILFDTSLKSSNDNRIFAILERNPLNSDGSKQVWLLSDFACSEEDTAMGKWLRRHFPDNGSKYATFSDLNEKANEVEKQAKILVPILQEYIKLLNENKIPKEPIHEEIQTFEDLTDEFKVIYEQVWGEAYPLESTIREITERVGEKTEIKLHFNHVMEIMDQLLDQVDLLFRKDGRLSNDEMSTPQKDKLALHQEYDNLEGREIDFTLFDKILYHYQLLLQIMEQDDIKEIEEQVYTFTEHFKLETTYRYVVTTLLGAARKEDYHLDYESLKQTSQIEDMLNNCKEEQNYYAVDMEDGETFTSEGLLNSRFISDHDGIALSRIAMSFYPDNEVERMLILADVNGLKNYFKKHPEDPMHTEKMNNFLNSKNIPLEFSYYSTATRLLLSIGNQDQLEEKYYILGLSFDEKRCSEKLRELYRAEHRKEEFQDVFISYSSNNEIGIEDKVYYLEILYQKSPEAAIEYARENIYLFYLEESLRFLLTLPRETFGVETFDKMRIRLESYENYKEYNSLEKAIIDYNSTKIQKIISDQSKLREMGYTEDEIDRIMHAPEKLESGYILDNKYYDIGVRLFFFQQNKNGLAERYMWEGIAEDRNIQATYLMVLLMDEKRWKESCLLYEVYENAYEKNEKCRQLYLISLLCLDPIKAEKYIKQHLQDCLAQIEATSQIEAIVQKLAENDQESYSKFYDDLMQLVFSLKDPFAKSVVLMDRTLREFANEATAQVAGLPDKYSGRIANLYKSKDYPHGEDALAISGRSFAFFGSYKGVAELFAKFALPDTKAIDQLWEIYQEMDEESLLFTLLQDYPYLREKHNDLYLKMLFQKERYADYIEEYNNANIDQDEKSKIENSWELSLQLFISKLKTDPSMQEPLPELFEKEDVLIEERPWIVRWGGLLISILLENGRMKDVETVLFIGFPVWLDLCSSEQIRNIVSGNGKAEKKALLLIQNDALSAGEDELAIYLYNIFNIGDLKSKSEDFLREKAKDIESVSSEDNLKTLNRLKMLFGDKLEEDDPQMSLLLIQNILETKDMSIEEAADSISHVIDNYPTDQESVCKLLQVLRQPKVGLQYSVYKSLAQFSEKLQDKKAVLMYFFDMIQHPEARSNDEFLRFVFRIFIDALEQGYFPDELLSKVEELCFSFLGTNRSAETILCLYFIQREKQQGSSDEPQRFKEEAFANYLLQILVELPANSISENLEKLIATQVKQTWDKDAPGFYELFKEYLDSNTINIDDIKQYIGFANSTIDKISVKALPRIQASDVKSKGRILSANESNNVILQLYAMPDDKEIWKICTQLPLQDSPEGYSKLLFLTASHNPELWKDCVDYCEKYDDHRFSELQLKALLQWAAEDNESENLRRYLESHLSDNPDYFGKWTEKQERQELVSISKLVCDHVDSSESDLIYASVHAASLIAEKTESEEALNYFISRFGRILFRTMCDLGVALAANLLLDERYDEAGEILKQLTDVRREMNYSKLVNELAEMTVQELRQWAAVTENNIMLRLILPYGNQPNQEQIQTITLDGIREGKAKETAEVFLNLSEMFPDDYAIYNALFDLSSMQFDGFVPILHQSLRGLIRETPSSNSHSYYRRDRKQYARMLATLDALLIKNKQTEQVKDYDFTKGTGEYYKSVNAPETLETAKDISRVQESINAELENRPENEVKWRSRAYISYITGNWVNFLQSVLQEMHNSSWNERTDVQDIISDALNCSIDLVDNVGFAQSLMQVLLGIEGEEKSIEREKFVSTLSQMVHPSPSLDDFSRVSQVDFVRYFLENGYLEELENQSEFGTLNDILLNPFRDSSYTEYLEKHYVAAASKRNSEHLFAIACLIGALVNNNSYMASLEKDADSLFDDGKDALASDLYHALYILNKIFNLDSAYEKDSLTKCDMYEIWYQAGYRIASLFSINPQAKNEVKSSDFKEWDCINMTLKLLYSKQRSGEVLRFKTFLSQDNAQLVDAILCGLNPNVKENEKLKVVDSLNSNLSKAYYCKTIIEYKVITDPRIGRELNRKYTSYKNELRNEKGALKGNDLSHIIRSPIKGARLAAFEQKDPIQWEISTDRSESEEKVIPDDVPFFAENLYPLNDNVDIEALYQAHQDLGVTGSENIQEKEQLSRKIYQYSIGNSGNLINNKEDALLLLGSDHYNFVIMKENNQEEARQTLFVLAQLLMDCQKKGYGYQEAKETIQLGLHELLISFNSLNDLIVSYNKNRSLYQYMRSVLPDPPRLACVNQIYTVLDILREDYLRMSRENPEELRETLSKCCNQLSNIENNQWMNLATKVKKLIYESINELDQRPKLEISVFNIGNQRNYGFLYGQVSNIGHVEAEDISVRAHYNDDSLSHEYRLPRLLPGSKAAFEVDYSFAAGVKNAEYELFFSFKGNGKENSQIKKGCLNFGNVPKPDYPADLLCANANAITFEVVDGSVYSKEFIGREKEKADLQALVSGKKFSDYKSALLYGIRRTGKSSLLNYFAAYINANCPTVICVKTDCQNVTATNFVQYVFIDRVIDYIEGQIDDLSDNPFWKKLKKKWYSEYFCVDEHLEKLELFYLDLRKTFKDAGISQGIYLIIDEIDRLFERCIESGYNMDNLFGTISAILNSSECREIVHLVICGSNWLIRYDTMGDRNNQLFQRFGKQVIEVGKLPKQDAIAVLKEPYRKYKNFQFTNQALEWIWDYTGGLVWHTKLLGEEAIQRAKNDGRNTVYPSDVQRSLPKVITERWCKQFYEGCDSGIEYRIVDAMQSLIAKRDGYINIDRIYALLKDVSEIDIQKALGTLKALKVVSSHPVEPQLYRFEQDIYRRYFREQPSDYIRVPEEVDIFSDVQNDVMIKEENPGDTTNGYAFNANDLINIVE